jgi:hypothetical protein
MYEFENKKRCNWTMGFLDIWNKRIDQMVCFALNMVYQEVTKVRQLRCNITL